MMATEKPMYVVIDLPRCVVVPFDAGVKLFGLLRDAEPLEYQWGANQYKRAKKDTSQSKTPSMRPFTLEEYAVLDLNED
jgi:hypothetical protein